jgi:DNA-binding CsgD family transcriptional regulator
MKQTPGNAVICADAAFRVIFISSRARELVSELFGHRLLAGQTLPKPLKICVNKLRERAIRNGNSSQQGDRQIFTRKDGSNVAVTLCTEPDQANHCLIFEQDGYLPEPVRMKELNLTPRQAEVVHWILQNKTSWEIGRILNISSRTVDKHVQNIFTALGVNNRVDLILKSQKLLDEP